MHIGLKTATFLHPIIFSGRVRPTLAEKCQSDNHICCFEIFKNFRVCRVFDTWNFFNISQKLYISDKNNNLINSFDNVDFFSGGFTVNCSINNVEIACLKSTKNYRHNFNADYKKKAHITQQSFLLYKTCCEKKFLQTISNFYQNYPNEYMQFKFFSKTYILSRLKNEQEQSISVFENGKITLGSIIEVLCRDGVLIV